MSTQQSSEALHKTFMSDEVQEIMAHLGTKENIIKILYGHLTAGKIEILLFTLTCLITKACKDGKEVDVIRDILKRLFAMLTSQSAFKHITWEEICQTKL